MLSACVKQTLVDETNGANLNSTARTGAGGIRCFPDRRPQLELPAEHHQISNRGGGAGGGQDPA